VPGSCPGIRICFVDAFFDLFLRGARFIFRFYPWGLRAGTRRRGPCVGAFIFSKGICLGIDFFADGICACVLVQLRFLALRDPGLFRSFGIQAIRGRA